MKNTVIGILAHVDAGKTTLSEALLFTSGAIRKLGRVDSRDAHLDTEKLERERGITIFSKQARFSTKEWDVTLLDTPGHVDFSAEMERTLQVLDYAILVISGADGVQGHTKTLWKLLQRYHIPVFLFINKMDQRGTDEGRIMEEIQHQLSDNCISFSAVRDSAFYEALAMCREDLLEGYLQNERIDQENICDLVSNRELFPCFFGSALKLQGVEEFLQALDQYLEEREFTEEFGAKVYKIGRDEQGNRLTYLKVTGGSLRVRDQVMGVHDGEEWKQKINQIRLYSGEKFQTVEEASAGMICAVTGLDQTRPGDGLGVDCLVQTPVLAPVLTYRLEALDDVPVIQLLPKLRQLEEEEPELHLVWKEELQELQVQVMGEIQMEILKSVIYQRFGVAVQFGKGHIVYKETIAEAVEGIGHFEPLRHYAEVHLLLEPAEAGTGMQFALQCSEERLAKNWQRLILTHLEEKEHKGVLSGSALTDMKISVIGGKAHNKHTEGGDFRQATYRAVRQGLMQTRSVLLEPYYSFRLEIPSKYVGRAMTDLDQRAARFEIQHKDSALSVIEGVAPVSTLASYSMEVLAYTGGKGKLHCVYAGYQECHNTQEVLEQLAYDPEEDLANPSSSVFCSHGSGYLVPWNEVREQMHVDTGWGTNLVQTEEAGYAPNVRKRTEELWIGVEEVDHILAQATHANQKKSFVPHKGIGFQKRKRVATSDSVERIYHKPAPSRKGYLLVDGYNVIFAWDSLNALAMENMDGARTKLMDILCNYQGMKGCELIVVFDAYRVKGHQTEALDYHNIHVVYTKEAETADQYIEKFAHENREKYRIRVATSDGLEQIIIRGQGCELVSSREFEQEVQSMENKIREQIASPFFGHS